MAVLVFLGVGISSFPTRLPDALAGYVGADRAPQLQVRVEALIEQTLAIGDTVFGAEPLEAVRHVESQLREAHPELSDDAIAALGWTFSYNSR